MRRGIVVSRYQTSSMDEDNNGFGFGASLDGCIHINAMSFVTAILESLVCLDFAFILLAVLGLEGFVKLDEGGWDVIVPSVANLRQRFLDSLHFDKHTR